MGRRSRRAPESAVTVSSLFPREQGQATLRQGVNGEAAVLVKEVLLGVEKKAFAATHGGRVEPQDTLDEGFGFGGEAIGGTDLRDQTDLLRAMRVDRSEEHTSELQSHLNLVCRLLLEKKKKKKKYKKKKKKNKKKKTKKKKKKNK